ncbi:metal-dependent hydrolase [Yersinia pekkanenii]|uniref:Metal-dependent hydrolase, membrane-bound n=1 Tax=Yersinia pekkanenii TaxID=1288385 RepID=A0A0T9REG1_9GAMM|nr:metal-dependent hydrolase [Yersinia pekkanenii]CNI58445.1 metal-dependent hydrolase%2C membrane-bound [Yersinia pekkanenii]CRY69459.1 metal-dependent hydrolase%2C membrane-bound [Yersinia pekkanenii]
MPTIITHAAVPLCIGLGLGKKVIPPALLLTGIVFSMIPDLDVLSFKLGIAYGNAFGHRGFTHSLLFAFLLPTLALFFRRCFNASYGRIWWFLTLSLLSHSVLDSLTTGGMGVGWLWPWSQERFFAPVQVIKVAPFQLSQYLKPNGIAVIKSELWWVWGPGVILMLGLMLRRMTKSRHA